MELVPSILVHVYVCPVLAIFLTHSDLSGSIQTPKLWFEIMTSRDVTFNIVT